MGCRAVHSQSEAYTFLGIATFTGAPSSRFKNWFHGRSLSSPLPLGPYCRSLKKIISLSIAVTKLNLEFDSQKKHSNVMLNGMRMNDLAQFAGPTMKKFEHLLCPLVRVFNTCLAKEMESMLFLESTSSAPGNHCFAHGACIFGCTLHSEDSASCGTSMQLFLVWLVFISASSISQAVSRQSCRCFRLICVSSHCWKFLPPSIDCFFIKQSKFIIGSDFFFFLIKMSLSSSTSRRGCFLGGPDFSSLLTAFSCLAYIALLRPARGGLSRQGWPGLVLKCGSIFVIYCMHGSTLDQTL